METQIEIKKNPKRKIIIIFLIYLAMAPVPLYMCGDDCQVTGFAPFIFGPISLFGIGTLFHWLPWLFAFCFASLSIFITLIIRRFSINNITKNLLIIFLVGVLFFSISNFLNYEFGRSEKFSYRIESIIEGEQIRDPNFIQYISPGNQLILFQHFFSTSPFDREGISDNDLDTDNRVFGELLYLQPNFYTEYYRDFCKAVESTLQNVSKEIYNEVLDKIVCRFKEPDMFIVYLPSALGNKYLCLDYTLVAKNPDAPLNNLNKIYAVDNPPSGFSCLSN